MKICIISEIEFYHKEIPDEGTRKFAVNFAEVLKNRYSVLEIINTKNKIFQKLLFDKGIIRKYVDFQPNIVFLFSTRLRNIPTIFLKYFILKIIDPRASLVLFSFQPIKHYYLLDKIFKFFIPDWIVTQSRQETESIKRIGIKSFVVPSGFDERKYFPVNSHEKIEIRKELNLRTNCLVALHVGHLNENRNVEVLANIKRSFKDIEVLIVVPPSAKVTQSIKVYLQHAGVELYQKYIRNIEKFYQASDCYIFPVLDKSGAIGFPLSVIEALACNVPVISTKFGGLTHFLNELENIFFVDNQEQIIEKFKFLIDSNYTFKQMDLGEFKWESIAQQIINQVIKNGS